MRLLTFSFIKNSVHKTLTYRLPRRLVTGGTPQVDVEKTEDVPKADPTLVQICPSWPEDEEPELRAAALRDMTVIPDFISEHEEAQLMAELEPYLKRMRYEFDHWDNAIQGYRETERASWSRDNAAVLARVRRVAFRDAAPLPSVHVLDLAAGGHIKPHVDAVRFCGRVIAGLCLSSSAVMRVTHAQRAHLALDALLQRRALYLMKDVARYSFAHAVLGEAQSEWRGEPLRRARRVAIISRSQPDRTDD